MITLLLMIVVPIILLYELYLLIKGGESEPDKVLTLPEPEDDDEDIMCNFKTEGNVFDFDRNVYSRKHRVPCNRCNQFVWMDTSGMCGNFEYIHHTNTGMTGKDLRSCVEYKSSINKCPFKLNI